MKPVQCHLWQKENLTKEDLQFENVHTYEDDFNIWHKLKKCPECGQLYFYEFYEESGFDDDPDLLYITYIPVSSRKEADAMASEAPIAILRHLPQIRIDHPPTVQEARVRWVGRN